MTNHFIIKCSCGVVLSQCRCPAEYQPTTIKKDACDKCHQVLSFTFTWDSVRQVFELAQNDAVLHLSQEEALELKGQIHAWFNDED